jgi:alcohol dehydrogenase, propanol-preferring
MDHTKPGAVDDRKHGRSMGGIVDTSVRADAPDTPLPERMQAALACAIPTGTLEVAEVAVPAIEEPTDLLVRVDACGICGTDLHILEGGSYRPVVPFVLGHEPVGTVVAAGRDATEWIGRRIAIHLFTGCGTCAMCVRGDERLCPDLRSITGVLVAWGGYAAYMRVHARQALDVPEQLSSEAAASLVDCGATAANAVRQAMARSPRFVLIVGAGPIGFMSAELLARETVRVQIVHRSPTRREALARLGHDVVATFDEVHGRPDVVIDCAGVPDVATPSINILGPRGAYILGGYARIPEFDLATVARKELSVLGVRSGTRDDLLSIMRATADDAIRIPEIATWPLAGINDALAALRDRRVRGKAIILPNAAAV